MRIAAFITLFGAILYISTCCISPSEARNANLHSQQLYLTYDIFVGGFHSGQIDLSVKFEENNYELFAITKSAGLIDYLVGFRSYAQTRGKKDNEKLSPISHHVNNLWTGDIRFVRMGYINPTLKFRGPEFTIIHPPPEVDDREIVPDDVRRNTIDPLSAALRASFSSKEQGDHLSCADSIPVFDGRRRYDLVFKDAGTEVIDGPYYDGDTRKCLASIRRIVGFSRNPFLPRSKDLEGGEIWFADLVPGWPPVPVRFKTDIGLGNAFVHLTSHELR